MKNPADHPLADNRMRESCFSYTGLILAGGRGQRVQGADKGLLTWKGKALIEYSLLALQPHCAQLYINCNRNQQRYRQYGHPLVEDLSPDFPGPLQALGDILPALPGTHFVLLPCDTPDITPALVARLLESSRQHPRHWIYATADGRDHPLHSVFPADLLPDLLAQVTAGEKRLMRALERIPSQAIAFPGGLRLNLNHLAQPQEGKV